MDTIGQPVTLSWFNGKEWVEIAELTSYKVTQEELDNLPEPVSGTIECDIIDFDEVFWCAYMGRMYAEYFRN